MKLKKSLTTLKSTMRAAIAAASCLLCINSAGAKDIKLPNDEFAIASVNIPNIWKPETVEHGVEAQSDDSAIYLSVVAVGSEKGLKADTDATFEMLKEHKVKIDESSQKETKAKINGFETTVLALKGKDEDGPCTIDLFFIQIKGKVLIMTFWITDKEVEKHSKEMDKILDSLKAIE